MQRLVNIGFRKLGEWKIGNGGIRPEFSDLADSTNILYAFVTAEEVLYVGKTIRTLKSRMCGYKNPGPAQSTNIKGNRLISDILLREMTVEIYALPDNGLLHFGIFHLNLAAGLEDSIVSTLKPRWNQTGKLGTSMSSGTPP